jgi:phosphatidylinositol-4,5-bisphosphate 3-kinase
MLSTGIPELKTINDIIYLRDALGLGSSDSEAALEFKQLIEEAVKAKSVILDHVAHKLAHRK